MASNTAFHIDPYWESQAGSFFLEECMCVLVALRSHGFVDVHVVNKNLPSLLYRWIVAETR